MARQICVCVRVGSLCHQCFHKMRRPLVECHEDTVFQLVTATQESSNCTFSGVYVRQHSRQEWDFLPHLHQRCVCFFSSYCQSKLFSVFDPSQAEYTIIQACKKSHADFKVQKNMTVISSSFLMFPATAAIKLELQAMTEYTEYPDHHNALENKHPSSLFLIYKVIIKDNFADIYSSCLL